ncbi:MAG: hypothetical protein E7277_03520 [Lachnospiraceae bacterium]|nr:hypothetical protein [Lachnospiraceae bacterium]
MKKLYWGVGILLLVLFCLWQLKDPIEVSARRWSGVTVMYFRYDEYKRRYELDMSATKRYEARLYAPYQIHVGPSPGYVMDYFMLNARKYYYETDFILSMQHSEFIRIYERPIPKYSQRVSYRYYDAARKKWIDYGSHVDEVKQGERYSYTFQSPPYSYLHVGSVEKNGEYVYDYSKISYKVDRYNYFLVSWYPSETYVYFYPEGGEGSMGVQSGYYGTTMTLNANRFKRPGYRFAGWKGKVNGAERELADGAKLSVTSMRHGERINLYAKWEPIFDKMFLKSNDLLGLNETTISDGMQWEDEFTFPELPSSAKGTLVGWSLEKQGGKPIYKPGSKVKIGELYQQGEAKRLLEWEGKNVTLPLYSVWDMAPEILLKHVYVPEKWANEGKISLNFLEKFLEGKDPEDGVVPMQEPEVGVRGGIKIVDYQKILFEEAKGGDVVTLPIEVYDKIGNCTEGELVVHVVATGNKQLGRRGRVRFIDEAHKETLDEKSVWRVDERLWELLKKALKG